MRFVDAETGIGTRLRNIVGAWLQETATSHDGEGWLLFSDRERVLVTVTMTLNRSVFSITGTGFMLCNNETACKALYEADWLELSLEGLPAIGITVTGVRFQDTETRCSFEVHS